MMRETNDGFEIARRDLEIRGPGEVLGTRQTGEMQFDRRPAARPGSGARVQALADRLLAHHPSL